MGLCYRSTFWVNSVTKTSFLWPDSQHSLNECLPMHSYDIWINAKEHVAPGIIASHLELNSDRTSYRFLWPVLLYPQKKPIILRDYTACSGLWGLSSLKMVGGTCTSLSTMLLWTWSGGMPACPACPHNPASCLSLPQSGSISSTCNCWQSTKGTVRYIWLIQVLFPCLIHCLILLNTA